MTHTLSVLFDLDDTLYLEREFWAMSSRNAIKKTSGLFGLTDNDLSEFFTSISPEISWIESFINCFDLPNSVGSELLWLYRSYSPPHLELMEGAREAVDLAASLGAWGIITNGRSLCQRSKLKALKLRPNVTLVSSELGYEKPDKKIFLEAQELTGAEKIIYVGDNPFIDFYAPRELGWETIRLKVVGQLPKHSNRYEPVDADWCAHSFAEICSIIEREK